MGTSEELIRSAVGARRGEETLVAVARLIGERDELRRMLQSGGLHDAEVRAALYARDGETTAEAARRAHGEIMKAEGRTDAILDTLSDALGVQASPEALMKGVAELSQAMTRIRQATGGFTPRLVADYAIERIREFEAMRIDRDKYERKLRWTADAMARARRVAELLSEYSDAHSQAAAGELLDACDLADDGEECPF